MPKKSETGAPEKLFRNPDWTDQNQGLLHWRHTICQYVNISKKKYKDAVIKNILNVRRCPFIRICNIFFREWRVRYMPKSHCYNQVTQNATLRRCLYAERPQAFFCLLSPFLLMQTIIKLENVFKLQSAKKKNVANTSFSSLRPRGL